MLERYYIKPDTIDRIRASWLGEPIERYVAWLTEEGYASRNVFRRVPILMHFGRFARTHGAKTWEDLPSHVDPFVDDWVQQRGTGCKTDLALKYVENAARNPVQQLLRLLLPNYLGGHRSRYTQDPFLERAPGFFRYLRDERGLRETSILHYGHYLRRFEAYLERVGVDEFSHLSPAILSAFVIESSCSLSKTSMTGLCSCLRVFLSYLHRESLIEQDLNRTVEAPQKRRLADIPRSIIWDQIRQMLEAVDRRTPLGKRDYAILLLLVTYGLRSREVAELRLDDIDWKRQRLFVRERKAGHSTAYPLSAIVGEAILEYLQNGRPETTDRHLFFRVLAPQVPLTCRAISGRASHYLRKAGIQVKRAGSHTLRHSCAQRLVDAEFSFKTIGDYMGHASFRSTEVYTKVSIEALREVAMGDGEELS